MNKRQRKSFFDHEGQPIVGLRYYVIANGCFRVMRCTAKTPRWNGEYLGYPTFQHPDADCKVYSGQFFPLTALKMVLHYVELECAYWDSVRQNIELRQSFLARMKTIK